MEFIDVLSLGIIDPAALLNILIVAVGLGLVIFFHELGHFLVAKWCDVYVERFSIGFGQPIMAYKWGETEYAFGWLPFGGYVKMLGQDDMDPGQMTDDQVADNPRSYTAKSVPQRMAIISAGVIMNVITGMIFFMLVFSWGIQKPDRVVGEVQVGMPAWKAGIRSGDTITSINDRPVNDYDDLIRGTVLSSGPISVAGFHDNGDTFEYRIQPVTQEIHKKIGVTNAQALQVIEPPAGVNVPIVLPGTAAANAGFQPGDRITAIDGIKLEDKLELDKVLSEKAGETVQVTVRRAGKAKSKGTPKTETLTVPPENFLGLGLKMGMGKIVALRDGSVAQQAGLQVGDRIAQVNGMDVETELAPFRLTETFSKNAGHEVTVTVAREVPGGSPETVTVTLVPEDRGAWSEPPIMEDSPLSIPSIGVAYQLLPTVFSVDEGGAAAKAGINPRDSISKVELVKSGKDAPIDGSEKEKQVFKISEEEGSHAFKWAYAMWWMQEYGRTRTVKLTVKPANGTTERTVELQPQPVDDWYLPTTRGVNLSILETERKADNFAQAAAMGAQYTLNSIEDIYLTLRGLFTQSISPKGLSGPIGIAKTAYSFANVGMTHFVLFLGLISINLAVINFLPIPVLDGGHMVFLLWEGLFRRKPSEKVVATATYCGLAFVLGLMIFVIFLDLTR